MIAGKYSRTTVPLAAITQIRSSGDGKSAVVDLVDGNTVTYPANEIATLLENTVQASFPSNGAKRISTIVDDNMKPCDVELQEIIGFYIDAAGELRAVTMEGPIEDPTILFADGHVERFEGWWKTLNDYKHALLAGDL